MRQKIKIDFTDFWHSNKIEDKHANPIFKLLSQRFDLEISERPDFLIYSCFGLNHIQHRGTKIFYTGENKRPDYAACDWALGFDYTDDPRFLRWPYYALADRSSLLEPRDADAMLATKPNFCAFIYSNGKARERMQLLDKLSRYKRVDCGGKARNNLGYRVVDKIAFLKSYKFTIAFENESYPGYTTEKLADALQGTAVPLYWGNPLANRDFNPEAFISAHDFRNLDQLVDFVVELDKNDSLYKRYLGAPPLVGNRYTEYLDQERVLNWFGNIFNKVDAKPVAGTFKGRVHALIREPARRLRQRRVEQKKDIYNKKNEQQGGSK
jgi:alpha(1,3/1,4) fucosyltransferase